MKKILENKEYYSRSNRLLINYIITRLKLSPLARQNESVKSIKVCFYF